MGVWILLSVLGALAASIVLSLSAYGLHAGLARRRAALRRRGVIKKIPVMLRGASSRYPGRWRSGALDPAAAVVWWRPRLRWGVPVLLDAARIGVPRPVIGKDGVGLLAGTQTVLICADRDRYGFELALVDAHEANLLLRRLGNTASGEQPPHIAATDGGSGCANGSRYPSPYWCSRPPYSSDTCACHCWARTE